MSTVSAISLVLAIYAFVTALLLFVAQTENYNRISHYWVQKKGRAWMVIVNFSRRYLIHRALHKPLSFKGTGLTFKKVTPVGDVGEYVENDTVKPLCDLNDNGEYEFAFDYMAPKSAIIAEFEASAQPKLPRPALRGVLKSGRLVKCFFWFDDPMHFVPLLLIGYLGFCVLVIGAMLYLRSKGVFSDNGPVWVYSIGAVIMAVGVYWFFCRNRRIFVKEYWKVRNGMK
jgi:hypothetical protein